MMIGKWVDGPPPRKPNGDIVAGALIELVAKPFVHTNPVLIGHENQAGGVCSCCGGYRPDEDIVRHMIVWETPPVEQTP